MFACMYVYTICIVRICIVCIGVYALLLVLKLYSRPCKDIYVLTMLTYICVCVILCEHACLCMYVLLCEHMHACLYIYTYVCVHVYILICVGFLPKDTAKHHREWALKMTKQALTEANLALYDVDCICYTKGMTCTYTCVCVYMYICVCCLVYTCTLVHICVTCIFMNMRV